MTSCQEIYTFLTGVSNRNVGTPLAPADVSYLQQLGLLQTFTPDQYAQLVQEAQSLGATRAAINQETASRAQLASAVQDDSERSHSILFHFEGRDKQTAELEKAAQDAAALRSTDTDLTARVQAFNQMVAKVSTVDSLSPFAGGYVGLTGAGVLQLRQLGIRIYRVSDLPFPDYWHESAQTAKDLDDLAAGGGQYVGGLSGSLPGVDRSYLWAIALGLAKWEPDVTKGGPMFLDAYAQLGGLTENAENRLMAAEMLSSLRRNPAESLPLLRDLEHEVRKAGVPKQSSLGVASMLLLGQRQDGTFATSNLPNFLQLTKSFESAALLAITNRPYDELAQKFGYLRGMFGAWGYEPSEDVELSAAYLTLSDLPADGVNTKLAIISKGMGAYLQYPLVASAILAAIPVLEANETLNLLEEAYEIVGRRAMPMAQPELICLAVRMVHGVRNETVQGVDSTGKVAPPSVPVGGYYYGPRFFFVPILVAHGAYYSTFSGLSGPHPGHAHFGGGGFTG